MASILRKIAPACMLGGSRAMSTGVERKVCVVGAAGGIGQSLSMLMKMNPAVTQLSLYDVMGTPGVAADVSHMNTKAVTTGHTGPDELEAALTGCDLVIIPAGVPRKPGMTRDDLFKINAGIVAGVVEGVAKWCPGAMINMISNPVNSTVPIAAEILKKHGVYDPKKLLGVTTLDVVRAKTFYAAKKGLPVTGLDVPVVGGHAGITILPLFSQANPYVELTDEEREALTKRTQDGGTEVVAAKAGKGSATLSMAYAGSKMADACLRGLNGQKDVIECSYVASSVVPGLAYFATKVRLGPSGVEEVMPIGPMIPYEAALVEAMKEELADSIKKGVDFVKEM
jgi:malate dehydrogenase